MQSVLEAGAQDEVTLMTCAGTFNNAGGGHDQRLVVRAARSDQ